MRCSTTKHQPISLMLEPLKYAMQQQNLRSNMHRKLLESRLYMYMYEYNLGSYM